MFIEGCVKNRCYITNMTDKGTEDGEETGDRVTDVTEERHKTGKTALQTDFKQYTCR